MKCQCDDRFTDYTCGNWFSCASVIQILLIVVSVLLVVGVITCILSHYKMGARSWNDQRNRAQPVTRMQLQSSSSPHDQQQDQQKQQQQQQYSYSLTTATSSVMYSPATVQERQRLEAGAFQDHLVQLHSVQTDLILDLPHSIHLPDGEEHYSSSSHCNAKHLKIRDLEQQAEITQNFIRPPPNRTVHEVDSLPPFRSNSVSLLQKPSKAPLAHTSDSAPLVMRSHSMSSSSRHHQKYPSLNTSTLPQLWISPLIATHRCPTNSSDVSSASSNNSNRTFCTKPVMDSKYSSTDPPLSGGIPAGSNQCDTDKLNSGV